jgi:hypothetical protein
LAKDDWAIVVGIKSYFDPDLAGLQGPETDAREFHDWVIRSDGGAVPEGQAKCILSSDYDPPFATAAAAMPTAEAVKVAFDHLRSIADENEAKGNGRVVGDRLYLFFSGHGFAPAHRDDLTALLTAEASVAGAQLAHILGPYMADWFWRATFFKQILLFMDCCREVMECAQLYMPYADERGGDYFRVRRLYAYGARVAKESREWKMADGQFHGVFTKTLLDALGGAGYDPRDPGNVTAESLRDDLYNSFKNFMSKSDRNRPDLPKEPEVVYEQKPGANFTIVPVAGVVRRLLGVAKIPKYPVTITASPAHAGKTATIRDKDLDLISEQALAATQRIALERGFYSIEVAGLVEPITFEVTSPGAEVDV